MIKYNITSKEFWQKQISKASILLIIVVCVWNSFNERMWDNNRGGVMIYDVACYYGYLTHYINHADKPAPKDLERYWALDPPNKFVTAENGHRVLKTTMGMAVLYLPFYFTGLIYHYLLHGNIGSGYEYEYRICMHFVGTGYLLLGLILLRTLLKRYFNDSVIALTIICIVFGTNMLYYTTYESCMTHVGNFFLYLCFIWLTIKWYRHRLWGITIAIGLVSGLLALIRPTNSLIGIVFLLYGVSNWQTLKERFLLLIKAIPHLIVLVLCSVIIWVPQMFYWHNLTGHLFFYSYVGERFYFYSPKIYLGLLSWRKGWLLYTPMGALMLIGFIPMYTKVKEMFWASLLFIIVFVYVIFSWWCWWYGGGFSIRAMVDAYCILALSLASLHFFIYNKQKYKVVKVVYSILLLLLVSLNLFQTYQYKLGYIHYDSMSKTAYKNTFLRLEYQPDSVFVDPPWSEAARGIPAE